MYRRCKKKENTEKGNALSRKPQRKDFYKNALKIRKFKKAIKMDFRKNSLKIRKLKKAVKMDFRINSRKIRIKNFFPLPPPPLLFYILTNTKVGHISPLSLLHVC